MNSNSIVQASAGSGKTFALTNRYLRLVASGVPCDSILATTFTRKAAGEILDRIIQRLTNAASDPMECDRLSGFLNLRLSRETAIQTLRHMTDNLHRLQIATLDSFFNRVARAFSFELGLPGDWQIVEGGRIDALSENAVRNLLHDQNTRSFLHLVTRNDAERRVADMTIGEVDYYFELYRDSTQAAWDHPSPKVYDFSARLDGLLAHFPDVTKLPGQLKNALEKDWVVLLTHDYERIIEGRMFQRILRQEFEYYRKPIDPTVIRFYQELGELCSGYATTIYADRTRSAWRLIDGFARQLWPMQMEAAQLRFSDVTAVLSQLMKRRAMDFEFRLDQAVEHLLLDEFQDTSPIQWQILQPIVNRIMNSPSSSFFCVGDKKQAIYAWRGGVSEMFDVVEREYGDRLENATPLTTSFRSCPVVIGVVNKLFQNLSRSKFEKEPDRQVLLEWQQEFPIHQTARTQLAGHVTLEQAGIDGEDDDFSGKESLYQATLRKIQHLYQASDQISIGVLVGGHEDIAAILFRLHQLGVPASEEGGSALNDSAAVNLILSALQLADHPGDGVARFHLSHSPLACDLGLIPENQSNQEACIAAAEQASLQIRAELLRHGFGKLIERLGGILDASCTSRERRRLDQLIEFAFDYDEPWTLRTRVFIEKVKKTKILEPNAATIRVMTVHASKGLEFDAVVAPFFGQVGHWKPGTPRVVSARSNPAEPIDLVHLYAGDEERRLFPSRIQEAFDEHRRQEVRERLCLLYVLMTRAIHALHMIIPKSAKPGQTSLASVVLDGLTGGDQANPPLLFEVGDPNWMSEHESNAMEATQETPVFFSGYHSAMLRPPTSTDSNETTLQTLRIDSQEPTPAQLPHAESKRKVTDAEPSVEDPQVDSTSDSSTSDSSTSDSSTSDSSTSRADLTPEIAGSVAGEEPATSTSIQAAAFHYCLQQIDWLDQLPSQGKLKKLLKDAGFSESATQSALRILEKNQAQGQLADLMNLNRYRDGVFQKRYVPRMPLFEPMRMIVHRNHKVTIGTGKSTQLVNVDRMVLIYEGDKLVGADLIQIVTALLEPAELEQVAEEQTAGLQIIRRAIAKSLGLRAGQIVCRILFTTADIQRSF